jgi:hypothetical protein
MNTYRLVVTVFLALVPLSVSAVFDSGRAGFSIIVNNEIYPYTVFSTYVLPGESLVLRINEETGDRIDAYPSAGVLDQKGKYRWIWTAPVKSGQAVIKFVHKNNNTTIALNVFIMVPSNRLKKDSLSGYLIGKYPPPVKDDPLYAIPDGFIKVTKRNLATPVSPHFVLGQFISPDQRNKFPKYMVLRERLILKLEAVLESLNARGYETGSLGIVAGYLTPAYNSTTGRSEYSRHIYGGAAIFIVDRDPADGMMDDLNDDGEVNDDDARIVFDLTDELFQEPDKSYLRGGLFLIRKTAGHGPMIMIDSRGYRKRWSSDADLFPSLKKLDETIQELRSRNPGEFK